VFTGIVEAALPVNAIETRGGLLRLTLDLSSLPEWQAVKAGDSIALNGCCLTVTELAGADAAFDAIPETQRLTNLGALKSGELVNVERAMQAGARFDGHFVQGHVDATGAISRLEELPGELRVTVDCGQAFAAQCILKGSVCIDGMSLTIAEMAAAAFTVALIPHTRAITNVQQWRQGHVVNLEADMIGKYVRRHMSAPRGSINEELLRRTGFMP
jgi:riboflavin synthase